MMNSMRPVAMTSMKRFVVSTQKRFGSAPAAQKQYVDLYNKGRNFKKDFLSDPATYPIIAVMSCALSFMTVMSIKCLQKNPDVRISPDKRKTMMRSWGDEEQQ